MNEYEELIQRLTLERNEKHEVAERFSRAAKALDIAIAAIQLEMNGHEPAQAHLVPQNPFTADTVAWRVFNVAVKVKEPWSVQEIHTLVNNPRLKAEA